LSEYLFFPSQEMIDVSEIEAIVEANRRLVGATLPILHAIQARFGYIPDEAIPILAEGLNLSRAEIHGVVTFYHDFRTKPPGKFILQVCRGEACQAKGGGDLEQHAMRKIGCDFHQTSADQAITLEPVFCLGNCGCSPSIRVGDEVFGRVDQERLDEIVGALRKVSE
jgi:formate dehydrogenase subunit gamma